MIPKTIHYCWFGGNKKPALIKKCIESWKKFCPDYEIKEWNENNFNINCNEYVQKAHEMKKWAFVADYARFFVLYNHGGVYLDTDVQLVKNLDDLVEKGKFAGFGNSEIVNTGLILAAEKGDWLCKEVMDSYTGETFVWDDQSKILEIGRRVTKILVNKGLQCNGQLQKVKDYTIYPQYYFNPTDGDMRRKVDKRAYSIHHYAATWFSPMDRFKNTMRRFVGHQNIDHWHKIKKIIKNR